MLIALVDADVVQKNSRRRSLKNVVPSLSHCGEVILLSGSDCHLHGHMSWTCHLPLVHSHIMVLLNLQTEREVDRDIHHCKSISSTILLGGRYGFVE